MSELGLYVVRVYRRDSRGVAGIIEDAAFQVCNGNRGTYELR